MRHAMGLAAILLLAVPFPCGAQAPPRGAPFRFARGQSVYVVAVRAAGDAMVFSHCRPEIGPAPLRLTEQAAKELVPAGVELLPGGLPDAQLRTIVEGLIRKFGRFAVATTPEQADLVMVVQAVYESWLVATAQVDTGADGRPPRDVLIGSIGSPDKPRTALANVSALLVPAAAWREAGRDAGSLLAASIWRGVEVKVFGGQSTMPTVQAARPGSPAQVLYPDPELVESWRRINIDPVSVEPMFKAFSEHPERPYSGVRQPDRTSTQVADDLRRQAGDRGFSTDDPFGYAIRNPLPQAPPSQQRPAISIAWNPCAAPQPARAPLGRDLPAAVETRAAIPAPPNPAAAGQPSREAAAPSFRSGVVAVAVPIVATAPGTAPVTELTASDFRVFEDGVEQRVAQLLSDAEPLHVVLLLDASWSMRARVENVRAAASAAIDALRPEDSVLIASFGGRPLVHCEWTHDRSAAREALLRVRAGGRGSRLYDAMDVLLGERLAAVQGRKVLMVLTDGLDVDSEWATGRSVLERLQAADVPVYALQYDTSADPVMGQGFRAYPKGVRIETGLADARRDEAARAEADRFLEAVTLSTGGRVVRAKMPDEIASAFEEIAADVRQQLVLYYYPADRAARAGLHAIRVEATRPGVTVRARTGYRIR
jgi:Ca-activated chloride channel homolog